MIWSVVELLLGLLRLAAVIFVVLLIYLVVQEMRKDDGVPVRELAFGLVALLAMTLYHFVVSLILPVAVLMAALLASDFLYPGSVEFARLSQLLPLSVSAWLAASLVRQFSEDALRRALERLGLDGPWDEAALALAEGLVIGLSLVGVFRFAHAFEPSVGVSAGVALAAGLICGFTSYYVRLYRHELGKRAEEEEGPEYGTRPPAA